MKKLAFIFALIAAVAAPASATVVHVNTSRTAVGKGIAPSREQAVQKALADAIARLNGAKLKSASSLKVSDKSSNEGDEFSSNYAQKIIQATSGRFDSYEVLSENQGPDGYEVEVKIIKRGSKKVYKAPGAQLNQRNLVIVTSWDDMDVARFGKKPLVAAHDLHQALSDEVYRARKFRLLDRSNTAILQDEEAYIKQRANSDEALRLGRNLGADYVLIYEVSKMGLKKGEKSKFSTAVAASELQLLAKIRIIDMASAAVKYSNTIAFSKRYKSLSPASYDDFIASAAAEISAQFHSGIFPPKIEKMSGKVAVFTQKIAIGSELDCYALGAIITDSRTGEKTREERWAAAVKVQRANEKQSYAEVTSGAAAVGQICRFKGAAGGGLASGESGAPAGPGEFVPAGYGEGF